MQLSEPQRCTLVNLSTGSRMRCQFNPVVLRVEGGAARYTRQAAIGAIGEELQYDGRENSRFVMEFYMDAIGTGFDIQAFNGFLDALVQPAAGAASQAPPALLVWPNLVEARVVVREFLPTYEQFAQDGRPLVCTTQVKVEAIGSPRGKR